MLWTILGWVEQLLPNDGEETDHKIISRLLESDGFELLMDKDKQLIDQIKEQWKSQCIFNEAI